MESRREFLGKVVKGACLACMASALPLGGKAFSYLQGSARAATLSDHEAMYYAKAANNRVDCKLCPWQCRVVDGTRGRCNVRENRGGTYYALTYGKACTVHTDPIEKKPLFHYLPGTNAFSIATAGCNFGCEFCQNWEISQAQPEDISNVDMPPAEVARLAKENGARSIAYTYSEPLIFFEYMLDAARAAKERGIGSVMISNGYVRKEPMKELCGALSAVKIDFKGFTDKYYEDVCHGQLRPVQDTLVLLKEAGIWFEMVVLLIPTLNDSQGEIREMSGWVKANLGPDVPIHFTRFYPTYKMLNLPPTPIRTLEMARNTAMEEGINFAYVGNLAGHEGESTYCPSCKTMLIKRIGYYIEFNKIKDGSCPSCSCRIPGVWS
ncbi:MAG TPA: AmmeMemoRadiSam system radical SAM enzyme [bacterium]|nr:AmmeMemoRadiSam system radical SAM enzyme [bacterium]